MINRIPIPDETIISKIYFIRDRKVMLDKDLGELYQVITGNLNKEVKRNYKRFPEDFMFQLSNEEFSSLIFQSGTSSWKGFEVNKICDTVNYNQPILLC